MCDTGFLETLLCDSRPVTGSNQAIHQFLKVVSLWTACSYVNIRHRDNITTAIRKQTIHNIPSSHEMLKTNQTINYIADWLRSALCHDCVCQRWVPLTCPSFRGGCSVQFVTWSQSVHVGRVFPYIMLVGHATLLSRALCFLSYKSRHCTASYVISHLNFMLPFALCFQRDVLREVSVFHERVSFSPQHITVVGLYRTASIIKTVYLFKPCSHQLKILTIIWLLYLFSPLISIIPAALYIMFRIVFWDVLPCKIIVVGRQFETSYSPPWELEISRIIY
jgi:hypothetical protein